METFLSSQDMEKDEIKETETSNTTTFKCKGCMFHSDSKEVLLSNIQDKHQAAVCDTEIGPQQSINGLSTVVKILNIAKPIPPIPPHCLRSTMWKDLPKTMFSIKETRNKKQILCQINPMQIDQSRISIIQPGLL